MARGGKNPKGNGKGGGKNPKGNGKGKDQGKPDRRRNNDHQVGEIEVDNLE